MTIKEQIHQLEQRFDRRLNSMERQFSKFQKSVQEEMRPMRDFLIGQQAIKELESGKNVSISPSVINIIKWLVLIIGSLVTGKILL